MQTNCSGLPYRDKPKRLTPQIDDNQKMSSAENLCSKTKFDFSISEISKTPFSISLSSWSRNENRNSILPSKNLPLVVCVTTKEKRTSKWPSRPKPLESLIPKPVSWIHPYGRGLRIKNVDYSSNSVPFFSSIISNTYIPKLMISITYVTKNKVIPKTHTNHQKSNTLSNFHFFL